jgi:hypothetical protein
MIVRIAGWPLRRQIAGCLVLILAVPTAKGAAMPWQDPALARQAQRVPSNGARAAEADNESGKPAGDSAQSDATLPDAPEVAQSSTTGATEPDAGTQSGQNQQQNSSQPTQDQQQNGTAQPVGTAAAPEVKATGDAGSRVSGAAIAPAKQRRVRTFLIRIGVVVAACVAVGTVVALTHATPSEPR